MKKLPKLGLSKLNLALFRGHLKKGVKVLRRQRDAKRAAKKAWNKWLLAEGAVRVAITAAKAAEAEAKTAYAEWEAADGKAKGLGV